MNVPSILFFTSPLKGEVGARSAPGEGAVHWHQCSFPLTLTLSPMGRGKMNAG